MVVGQVASQQLPEPTTPAHRAASDLIEQRVTTGGHVALLVHAVVDCGVRLEIGGEVIVGTPATTPIQGERGFS